MNNPNLDTVAPAASVDVRQVVREVIAAMPIVIFANAVIAMVKESGRKPTAVPFQHSSAVRG